MLSDRLNSAKREGLLDCWTAGGSRTRLTAWGESQRRSSRAKTRSLSLSFVRASSIAERLQRGESVVFLALLEEGGGSYPAGFIQLYPLFTSTQMRRTWLLNDLFVAPEARRRGVGRVLMEQARRFAEENGAAEMMLQTAVTNTAAQALYESLGRRQDNEHLAYTLPL